MRNIKLIKDEINFQNQMESIINIGKSESVPSISRAQTNISLNCLSKMNI